MHHLPAGLGINGVLDREAVLDGGKRLFIRRVFAEDLLDIEDLDERAPFRPRDPVTGECPLPNVRWLEDALREGRLRFVGDETLKASALATQEMDHEEILAKDPWASVKRRLVRSIATEGEVGTDPDLGARIEKAWAALADDVARIASERPGLKAMTKPRTSTVRGWLRKVDPLVATMADMMCRTGLGRRAGRLDPEIRKIVDDRARWHYDLRGRRKADLLPQVKQDVDALNVRRAGEGLPALPYPGKETLRRAVEAAHTRDNFARKWGEAAARSRWDGTGKGLSADRILAVALIDDTVIDAITVFDTDRGVPAGRPWLVVIMDVYSRCILGWVVSFVPPSVHTAAECLRRANRPKAVRPDLAARYPILTRINGRMSRLVSDNGSNFASGAWQEILADLGIDLERVPVGAPRHKAMLERFFYTLKTMLLEKVRGATLNPMLLREFDIDPEQEAVITLTELRALIEAFVATYHVTVHSGIGTQPANRWLHSMEIHGRDIIADERKLSILTGVTVHGRRLYRGRIRAFSGLVYSDPIASAALNDDLRGAESYRSRVSSGAVVATVRFKYDPENLRSIWVWNAVRGIWVELPCTCPEYADGLSLWQHDQIRKWAKRSNRAFNTEAERLDARHALNALVEKLAPEMKSRERRAVARLTAIPEPSGLKVELAEAEPRHDGMAPVIEHGTNEHRADADIEPSRPSNASPGAGAQGGEEDVSEGSDDVPPAQAEPVVSLDADDDDDQFYQEFE